MAEIIPLNKVKKIELPMEEILESARRHLDGCVIVGFDKNSVVYTASSYADGGTVLWLLECCKKSLFDTA